MMTNYELVFIYDLVQDSQAQIFFFEFANSGEMHKLVELSDVREIQKRRFLGQNTALELMLMSHTSLLVDFKDIE